ncbi:hypothetical protein K474DRAFT_361356 [Panus rudis PR-1116 ss-1]|nr:hypothetical protein K474DRAFT_361356 [Panus rudis PR-1116 ss-1]
MVPSTNAISEEADALPATEDLHPAYPPSVTHASLPIPSHDTLEYEGTSDEIGRQLEVLHEVNDSRRFALVANMVEELISMPTDGDSDDSTPAFNHQSLLDMASLVNALLRILTEAQTYMYDVNASEKKQYTTNCLFLLCQLVLALLNCKTNPDEWRVEYGEIIEPILKETPKLCKVLWQKRNYILGHGNDFRRCREPEMLLHANTLIHRLIVDTSLLRMEFWPKKMFDANDNLLFQVLLYTWCRYRTKDEYAKTGIMALHRLTCEDVFIVPGSIGRSFREVFPQDGPNLLGEFWHSVYLLFQDPTLIDGPLWSALGVLQIACKTFSTTTGYHEHMHKMLSHTSRKKGPMSLRDMVFLAAQRQLCMGKDSRRKTLSMECLNAALWTIW